MGVRDCICSPSITSNEKVGSCDTTQCCPPQWLPWEVSLEVLGLGEGGGLTI